jgi:predicted CopG family antitoxin
LTITIDEDVYQSLQEQIGADNISKFIEELVRPYLVNDRDLEEGYQAMAADRARERDAQEWSDSLIGDALA